MKRKVTATHFVEFDGTGSCTIVGCPVQRASNQHDRRSVRTRWLERKFDKTKAAEVRLKKRLACLQESMEAFSFTLHMASAVTVELIRSLDCGDFVTRSDVIKNRS